MDFVIEHCTLILLINFANEHNIANDHCSLALLMNTAFNVPLLVDLANEYSL